MFKRFNFFKKKQKVIKKKEKPSIYIASAIEYAADLSWRDWIQQNLETDYNVIIPDILECPFDRSVSEYPKWVFDNYIMPDLKHVAAADHIFVMIDDGFLKGAGGKSEVSFAAYLNKPITYILRGLEPYQINNWTLGCLHSARRFNSLPEMVDYYKTSAKMSL